MAKPTKAKSQVSVEPAKQAVVKSFRDYNMKKDLEGKVQKYVFIYPGQGDTGAYLMVRSQHCEEYREASIRAQRQMSALIAAADNDITKVDDSMLQDINRRAFCKLIESWNFPDEFNDDNLLDFFDANPIAYDEINILAATDTLFFSSPVNS